ncbi:60S RIBOSOMAL PROTEIN L37A-2 [Salix purpurea]|uniref:60S RIBOSOMAL PROTEIN L37A-2 n=1 Tax=Salix purpurea TaxID=77065 RepID=A0A9Q0TA23_SALPP|nr:60S RIBOSOMAL PROTEIN L37A-2 [Salix purpurea]
MEVSQHSKFFCEFCGKYAVKRKAVGIWGCKDCGKVKAGGAYTLNTASAVTGFCIVAFRYGLLGNVFENVRSICLPPTHVCRLGIRISILLRFLLQYYNLLVCAYRFWPNAFMAFQPAFSQDNKRALIRTAAFTILYPKFTRGGQLKNTVICLESRLSCAASDVIVQTSKNNLLVDLMLLKYEILLEINEPPTSRIGEEIQIQPPAFTEVERLRRKPW